MADTKFKRPSDYRDELARRVARMHYEGGLSTSEIFTRLKRDGVDIRGVRDVRALIALALDRKLVQVRVQERFESAPVDAGLSERLEARAGLRKAIVVASDKGKDEGWVSADERERLAGYLEGDKLHVELGDHAARYLIGTLRDNDTVGVGPGRGVGFCFHALRDLVQGRRLRRRFEGVRVFSLAGRMHATSWSGKIMERTYMEADENAQELAEAIGVDDENLSLARVQLFLESDEQYRKLALSHDAPHMDGDDWRRDLGVPNIGLTIFGVGSLNVAPGAARGVHWATWLKNVPSSLKKDVEVLRTVVRANPGAIVDISDRLYVCHGGAAERMSATDRKTAKKAVESINENIVSVTFKKLQASNQRMCIAGGDQKYDAVLALMNEAGGHHVKPTILVTDSPTAERLLNDLPKVPQPEPAELRPRSEAKGERWFDTVMSARSEAAIDSGEPVFARGEPSPRSGSK